MRRRPSPTDPVNANVKRFSVVVCEYFTDNRLKRESLPFFVDAANRFKPVADLQTLGIFPGWSVQRTYTGGGNVATETDALGRTTTYSGHLTFVDPFGFFTDRFGTQYPDAGGRTIEMMGKPTQVTDWLSRTTAFSYDAATGNLLYTDNAKNERTRFEYNARGEVTKTYRDDNDGQRRWRRPTTR